MPLFEVVILESPTPKQIEDGASERLIVGPVCKVAKDAQSAAMLVAVGNSDIANINPDRMQVIVRPFK